jgi:hypothetical protein
VIDSKTGVLARRITPYAFAEATQRLATVPGLFEGISRHLNETANDRSTQRFLRDVLREIETLRSES